MTDLNKTVPHPRNKTLSFLTFEKEKWSNIYRFICGKKVKETPDIGVLALTWKLYKDMAKEPKKTFIYTNIFSILHGVTEGLKPYVDLLLYGSLPAVLSGSEKAKITFLGFAMLLALQKILMSLFNNMSVNIGFKFREVYFNKKSVERYKEILAKPRAFFIKNMPETISGLADNITQKEAMLLDISRYNIKHLLTFFVAAISLFMISPLATVIIVLLSLIRVEYDFYWSNYFREKNNKNRMFSAKVGAINRDVLRNTSLVQDGLMTEKESFWIGHRLNHMTHNNIKVMFAEARNSWTGFYVGEIIVSFLAAMLAVADILKTGDIGRFALISGAIYYMTGCISMIRHNYLDLCVKYRNTIVDTKKQLMTPRSLERQCGDKELADNDNKITLKNVTFSYPKITDITQISQNQADIERAEEVLHNINAQITKGGITVIAGTSGQGKSTLMSLIRHDYDVTGGQMLIGNTNIQEMSDNAINKQIAFIDQNVHFFDNTLLYNLKYFNPDADDKKVREALDSAGLTEDIKHFRDGIFHRIGQDGRALSGGQRQRLALARTFLTDRPIIIMDEPTTGLDQVLSFKVMKALHRLAATKTILLVTHNPTEIALANRVLIINRGKIAADGSPLELIETSDFLKSAMTKQDIISKQQLFAQITS